MKRWSKLNKAEEAAKEFQSIFSLPYNQLQYLFRILNGKIKKGFINIIIYTGTSRSCPVLILRTREKYLVGTTPLIPSDKITLLADL